VIFCALVPNKPFSEAFREMVKDRTYAALESRAKEGKATGGRAYGYRDGAVDKGEAYMVREIFGRSLTRALSG